MTIKIGDPLPQAKLAEFIDQPEQGCSIGCQNFELKTACANKTIAIFAVPGAFTPTCSNQHLPGFLDLAVQIKSKGVDEIWCLSVNDAFVMGAWGREHKAGGKVRMIADGNGELAHALGLTFDLNSFGMGQRSQRFSMIAKNGVVTQLNIDAPGKFEISDAQTLLKQLG